MTQIYCKKTLKSAFTRDTMNGTDIFTVQDLRQTVMEVSLGISMKTENCTPL